MGAFQAVGTTITKAPWFFALLMPAISILLIIVGLLGSGEIEDRVSNIWIPEGTQYYDDSQYKEDNVGQPAASVMSAVARPRTNGANVLTAENLLSMRDRMQAVEQASVEVSGMSFDFEDVCYNLDAYRYPCFRMTPLDCFAEGGYSWDADARGKFFESAMETATRDLYKGFVDKMTAEILCHKDGAMQRDLGSYRYSGLAQDEAMGHGEVFQGLPGDEAWYNSSTNDCTTPIIDQGVYALIFWGMNPKRYLDHVVGGVRWGDTGTKASVQLPPDAGACKCCVDDNVANWDEATKDKFYYTWAYLTVGTRPKATISLVPEYYDMTAIDPAVNPVYPHTTTYGLKHPDTMYYDYTNNKWPQIDLYNIVIDSVTGVKSYTPASKTVSEVVIPGLNSPAPGLPDPVVTAFGSIANWNNHRETMENSALFPDWDNNSGTYFSPPLHTYQEQIMDGLVDMLLPNVLKILVSSTEEEFVLGGAAPFEGFDVVDAPNFVNYDANAEDADINRPKLSTTTLTGTNAAPCQNNEAAASAIAEGLDFGFLKNCFQLATGAQLLRDADMCSPIVWLAQLCSKNVLAAAPLHLTCDPRPFAENSGGLNTTETIAALAAMGVPNARQAAGLCSGTQNQCLDTSNFGVNYYNVAIQQHANFVNSCPLICKSDSTFQAMEGEPTRQTLRATHDAKYGSGCTNTELPMTSSCFLFNFGFDYPAATCSADNLDPDGVWTAAELTATVDLMSEDDVLKHSSKRCYMFDQGAALPPVQTAVAYGGPSPKPFDYGSWALHGIAKPGANLSDSDTTDDFYEGANLTKLEAIQNLFVLIGPDEGSQNIVERLANRDDAHGGPVTVTKAQAQEILRKMKAKATEIWSEGWDGVDGSVQFNAFIDDNGVGGTFADAMDETTREMESFGIISYGATIVISVWFLYDSSSVIRSRVGLAWWGVVAAILALGGGLGIYCFFEKLNVAQMWTIPFLLLGIGIDDMYIMSLAAPTLPKGKSAEEYFVEAYSEVAVPMTMTSLTLIAMFGIMNLIRVPAVYLTALSACICVFILWLSNMFSFAAMVLLDLQRQEAQRMDVFCCKKTEAQPKERMSCLGYMYMYTYKPLHSTLVGNIFVVGLAVVLASISAYGITDIVKGLTIGDFAKDGTQMGAWVDTSQKLFGTWSFGMNWIGEDTDYTSAATHMKMTKSWEMVAGEEHVLVNSSQALLFPAMALWGLPADMTPLYNHGNKGGRFSSDYCNKSFTTTGANCSDRLANAPYDPAQAKVPAAATCKSKFVENTENLKLYAEPGDLLYAQQQSFAGVCLRGSDINEFIANLPACDNLDPLTSATYSDNLEYCPVMEFTDETHFQTCYELMAAFTNVDSLVGAFTYDQLTTHSDALVAAYENHDPKAHVRPILPIKVVGSASGTNVQLENSQAYIDLIKATRPHCDDKRGSGDPRCFMDGIAYTYWEQYLEIENWLWAAVGSALAAGWAVSSLFILTDLVASRDVEGSSGAKFCSSFMAGFLITFICAYCTFVTLGLSMLAGVQLSGFSAMSCILSVGFAVEYAVHIVHRFIKSPEKTSKARSEYAMAVLYKPTFMAFCSTGIGVVCIGFSGIHFVTMTFFTPLLITCLSTWFGGTFFLPVLLNILGPCMTSGLGTESITRLTSFKDIMEDEGL